MSFAIDKLKFRHLWSRTECFGLEPQVSCPYNGGVRVDIIFLSVNDVQSSEYIREGSKNLLKTRFCTADTIALCGRLEDAERTKYGPRLWINDGERFPVVIGTFNKNVRRDAEQIVDEFKKNSKKETYVLIYGNPYETDKIYINVNHENCVIVVDKAVYEKFHEMRKLAEQHVAERLRRPKNRKAIFGPNLPPANSGSDICPRGFTSRPHLTKKSDTSEKKIEIVREKGISGEISDSDIINLIKKGDKSSGVRIDEFLKLFEIESRANIEEKIYQMVESGELYEPRAGFVKVVE